MNSFNTVALLLAGLIATCTGRNIEADQETSPLAEISEAKELIQRIETACYEKTGSRQTFNSLGTSFAVVPMCFFMQINGADITNDLNVLKANATSRHEFFPKYCPQIRNALPCLSPPINELSKCLDDDEVLVLYGTYNASYEALDLICENDGELLFHEDASLDVCLKKYSNYSEECADLVSSSTYNMTVSKYDESQCEELAQVRSCMQKKFNECNGARLMDLFDVFWRVVLNNTPCKNFITGINEIDDDKAR